MSQPLRHDPYAALRIPNFRWFVASLMAMTVATQIQTVVVAWQIYELTHDPLSLGLIGLAEAVPFRLGAELVPRELYPNAVTWRSSTWQLAEVVGPAIGGLVYGFSSATAAYGTDAAIMAIGVVSLASCAVSRCCSARSLYR